MNINIWTTYISEIHLLQLLKTKAPPWMKITGLFFSGFSLCIKFWDICCVLNASSLSSRCFVLSFQLYLLFWNTLESNNGLPFSLMSYSLNIVFKDYFLRGKNQCSFLLCYLPIILIVTLTFKSMKHFNSLMFLIPRTGLSSLG